MKKQTDPVARLRALLEDQDHDSLRDEVATLRETRAGLAQIAAAGGLVFSLQLGDVELFEALLDAGVDPDGDPDAFMSPLAGLTRCYDLDDEVKAKAAERLLARGAKLGFATGNLQFGALDWAVNEREDKLRDVLLAHAPDADTLLNALIVAIRVVDSVSEVKYARPGFDALLPRVADVNAVGRWGLTPLHEAALRGEVGMVDALLARGARWDVAVAAAQVVEEPKGGTDIEMRAGDTVQDLVDRLHAIDPARFAGVRERAGAPPRHHAPAPRDGFRGEIDRELDRLVRASGNDLDRFHAVLDSIAVGDGTGPWGYLTSVIDATREQLCARGVADRARATPLGIFLLGEDKPFKRRINATEDSYPNPRDYPAEARKPLEDGVVVGGRGTDLLVLWPSKGRDGTKTARVCWATRERFEVLADTVPGFLAREVARLVD
jgi:hypothetical protein